MKKARKLTKEDDISKKALAILLVITIIISVAGTFLFLNAADNMVSRIGTLQQKYNTEAKAKIGVTITPPQFSKGTSTIGINIMPS